MANKRDAFENELVQFLLMEYFEGDKSGLAKLTGYSKKQISAWAEGDRKPTKATIRAFLSAALKPEMKIVCEYFPVAFNSSDDIGSQLEKKLGDHAQGPGVFAFYDSLCHLFYVGNSSWSLYREMHHQLNSSPRMNFPKAASGRPEFQWQVTAFISAYQVPLVDHINYPLNVGSLIRRISRPAGNVFPGNLNSAGSAIGGRIQI